jgi:hypothetical protein
LETQLETVIANRQMILAMHESLKSLLPKYETEFSSTLASQQTAKTPQQDANRMWLAEAKGTLDALRH